MRLLVYGKLVKLTQSGVALRKIYVLLLLIISHVPLYRCSS